jgi:hypothetical protein
MFNTIINILDHYNISPEREGQVQQSDGSILYRNDTAILWNFEGVRYQACPAVNGEVWVLYLDDNGIWKVNSKLRDLETVIEFGHSLASTIIEEQEIYAS